MNKGNKNNIVIYQDKNGEVELRADIDKDTIWATQEQIAQLFSVSRPNITMHLVNIFKTEELDENSVSKDFLQTASDGKKYKVQHYNLDAIISVGYRVNSKKATQFRIWATRILREYLKNGYVLNKHTLEKSPEKLVGLYDAITMLESNKGKLKGKISIKLTQDLEPNPAIK